ncbi:family 20 glycosylhydrolase [Collinsella sp. AGMB00827]|uniref:Family 20 glycosylhydrolase n=1 Tax=Collinsella ureilytica TaxID=2869515 RepID=A0ABS7MLE6_9ACTN|nr:family 20 glycosylhydrolase [Collinsella urealyticum]MBY4798181.1 family 20 glycosylhydrolase [Collinsella urealyticum]
MTCSLLRSRYAFAITWMIALLACFCLGVPSARAAEVQPKSVFSIDAGRKFFSADQLFEIIDHAADRGYTDIQLILGNDGLRFVLDDMTVSLEGGRSWTSDAVKAAIQAGNKSYYDDPNDNVLTQAEMDRVLARAIKRGLHVTPLINSPGHMDALLVAMKELGIQNPAFSDRNKTSVRTVDLDNAEALSFTKALIQKYATYFGASGASEIFNFGAGGYANDVFRDPGWSAIQRNGKYSHFVRYANDLSGII